MVKDRSGLLEECTEMEVTCLASLSGASSNKPF